MSLTQVPLGMLTSDAQYYDFKNRVINGAMMIDQRNAGASVSANDAVFGVDRWSLYTQTAIASKGTFQQNAGGVTPPAGFKNYLGFTSSSAYSVGSGEGFCIQQRVEGYNVADLAWGTASAATVTLSFRVYSSLTGTFGGSIMNAAVTRSFPFTYTIAAANTWTTVSITIPGETTGAWVTNNGIGMYVLFGLGVGSTYSGAATGAWQAAGYISATGATSVVGTNGATFYITGVQLERGSSATAFDYRDYTRELQMCQRYFCKSYDVGTAIGTVTSNGWLTSQNGTNGVSQFTWSFPVEMRASPTVTYQANGAGSSWYDSTGGYIMTPSTQRVGSGRLGIRVTGGNGNSECSGHAYASAEL